MKGKTHHGPGSVPEFITQIANRVADARQISVICSFGPPGAGKSDGNLLLGCKVQEKLGTGKHTPERLARQLVFKPKNFPAMAQQAPPRHAVYCDEGSGEGANKMRQMGRANVDVGIDLDACRGRCQPVFWANPYRRDLTPQVLKHMTWALEWHMDHSVTFWEAEPMDPIFGREPYLHERFTIEEFPWYGAYQPEVHAFYNGLKDEHMSGVDVWAKQKAQQVQQAWVPQVRRLLDEDAKSRRSQAPFPGPG